MSQYVVVQIRKNEEWEQGRYYDLEVAKDAARDCERLSGDTVELRQYVDEEELDYNCVDYKLEPEEITYIINTKGEAKSYKTYAWKEVLEYFGAPEDISDIVDLEAWIIERDGVDVGYIIEEF